MSIRHLEVLVEESSMQEALKHLLPRIVGTSVSCAYFNFRSKDRLLRKLPARLAGYRSWITAAGAAVLVVLDRDNDDCSALKARLDQLALDAGLSVCTVSGGRRGEVLNRIAVEELESWFFGDVPALHAAYPRVSADLGEQQGFRDPDGMSRTWEQMERILQAKGYHPGRLMKSALANDVAPRMNLAENRSGSFRTFVSGVRYLVEGAA